MKDVRVDMSNLPPLPEGDWEIVLCGRSMQGDYEVTAGHWRPVPWTSQFFFGTAYHVIARPLELGDTK